MEGLNPRYTWTSFEQDLIKMDVLNLFDVERHTKCCIQQLVVESETAGYFWDECQS